ncbi:hypothetical protein CC1G_03985 [Coprinopsis cinerea okayama7|uniref:Uncharacterized protein n=1 Tax=Coprinopsis cinerea (strain Okayama-7 / 130 / ATCC MYA-4618 / FGSC 9003) TaxID=240176 RepID=A8N8D8_COPC7|nr:hypothetical protein CC1G_03985 [Coprinopsis cinerea okayama7\|eukprot:XP_001831094.1 hypothetical protein CC1G_03985 [Coprinopsis cinerea okayama7\
MLISTIVLAISFLVAPAALANPTSKRAYIPELKLSLEHIDQSWKKLEGDIVALSQEATTEDFEAVKSSMDTLTSYVRHGEYQVAIRTNGPFTNTKWSDEFIEDMKPYQANGANALRNLRSHVTRINETGGIDLLREFDTSTASLTGAFGEMEWDLERYFFQFVSGKELLAPIRESRLVQEGRETAELFYQTWCAIEWGQPCW